jgi:hypothetical protein
MFCGLISGAVAQFFASPADLVKVQMQMEGIRRLQGLPPRSVVVLSGNGTLIQVRQYLARVSHRPASAWLEGIVGGLGAELSAGGTGQYGRYGGLCV